MLDEKEIKDRILKKGQEMFLQFGFSKVTMEELASEMGMSKKTLYKYYSGKEQLLREIISEMKCSIGAYTNEIRCDCNMDFMQKLKLIMSYIGQHMSKMRGPLILELQKNHPDMYNEIIEFRRKGIMENFSTLVKEGVKAGIFRKDIDDQIIVLIYAHVVSGIINPDVLSQLPYTGDQVFESIVKVILQGVLTEEGKGMYHSTKTISVKI